MANPTARALFPDELPETREGLAPAPSTGRSLEGAVDVFVDKSGRLGPLSYQVPDGLKVRRGDAVKVPFGTRNAYGLVLGPGDPAKATRPVTEVYGKRVTAAELDFAARVAREHFCDLTTIAARLAPREGKGAPAVDAGTVKLSHVRAPYGLGAVPGEVTRRYLLCAPLVDQTLVAAREAARLAEDGQVLILCPTVEKVCETLTHFESGASRLDATAAPGSWKGFAHGSVRVGIGTRTAALYSAESLAGIVVVEEDHPGHRERVQPYTNARDLALARSAAFDCAVSIIGSCPTPRGLGGKVKAFPVGSRRDWPNIVVASTEAMDPTRELPPSVTAAARRQPTTVVVEPSARMLCRQCSNPRRVQPRAGSLAFDAKTPCSECGSVQVRQVNWDPVRAEAALPGAATSPLEDLTTGERRTVVLPAFDSLLARPVSIPESRALHAVLAAARAAGPGGTVVLVTRQPAHPLVRDLSDRDLVSQAQRMWKAAKKAEVPPFSIWVRVLTGTERPPRTTTWPGRVLGPRRVGKEWEILIQVPRARRADLEALIPKIRRRGKTRVELV